MITATLSETVRGGETPLPPFYGVLGDALRRVRELKRMSLQDVETLTGGRLNKSRVASYEKGYRRPSIEALCELASFYGIPVSQLLPDAGGALPDPLGDVIALLEGLRGEGK